MKKRRLENFRKTLARLDVGAFLVSKPENIRYLCGFTGSSGALIVAADRLIFSTDSRYELQARAELRSHLGAAADFELVITRGDGPRRLETALRELEVQRIAFEAHVVSVQAHQDLRRRLAGIELVPVPGLVEDLRIVKEEAEIANIARAASVGDRAFAHILTFIKPGVSERQIALELEFYMRAHGAEKASFDVIVASGANSAMPHARTTDKKVQKGDLVKLDFGAVCDGYHSDMTRTVVAGKSSQGQRAVYNLVLEANERALAEVLPGRTGQEVDRAARDYFKLHGFADEFGHNVGHGVGLQVHELPVLGPKAKETLEAQTVVTIEPGLYFKDFGGVRIEDLVVVKETGADILTKTTKELIEL